MASRSSSSAAAARPSTKLDPAPTLASEHVATGEDTACGAIKMSLGQNGRYSWDFEPSYAPAGSPADAMS